MEFGIVWLVRGIWVAGILPMFIASLPFSWPSYSHGIVLWIAKRGKTMQVSSRFTVPQKFFSHFYVVAIVWTSILLVTTWIYAYTIQSEYRHHIWRSVFLLLLMKIHLLRRLYETIYVFCYSPSARMHIIGYLTGIFFYVVTPISLCCHCVPEVYEFIVRGKNRSPEIGLDWLEFVIPLMKLGWLQWIGAVIFFWGWIHQRRCHAILGSLRENRQQSDKYSIPRGDWFEFVSSPHYLAEIVLYSGILIASGGTDITIWLLFSVVVANLVLAAAETQKWYLQKFENYPRNRLAVIPFLY